MNIICAITSDKDADTHRPNPDLFPPPPPLLPLSRYDSDNERVTGDVGMAGVAIDSVEDMKVPADLCLLAPRCAVLCCLSSFWNTLVFSAIQPAQMLVLTISSAAV